MIDKKGRIERIDDATQHITSIFPSDTNLTCTFTAAATANTAAAATMLAAANINATASAFGVGHSGGMVGNLSSSRIVPASTFIGAPRLHGGLADDEFATILQKGEVVLNKDNVAEMKDGSGGGGSGGSTTIFNVTAIDAAGVSNFFKKNRRQLANALGQSKSENSPARGRP